MSTISSTMSDTIASLTPGQTRFVKHLNGLAPLATSVVTPVVANYQFKRAGVADRERKILVFQEVVRQGISSIIGLTTYYGGMALTGRFFKGAAAQKTLAQIIGGTAMSFVGYGFIRPMVSSEIIARWLQRWGQSLSGVPQAQSLASQRLGVTVPGASAPFLSPLTTPVGQQQGFDCFMKSLQTRAFR